MSKESSLDHDIRTLFFVVEVLQEHQQLVLVPPQNALDLWRLLRIRNENLEDVESLELYVLAPIPQHVHHHLQITFVGDVPRHDVEIGPVQ